MNPKQITRAILGIAIALGVSSFTTGTKEALATTEVLATIDEVEQPHGYMIANYTIHFLRR